MNYFLTRYSDDPGYKMAVGESAGNMLVEGTMSENEASTGVAYVDDAAVYEKKVADAGYELAYVNFSDGITRADGGNEFYIKDYLGSTRAIMTENGVSGDWLMNGAMAYMAYGAIKHLDNVPETGRKKFTGKEFDEEGGIDLNYFGTRYYDAEVGVWTSTDPVHGNDWSPFVYCHNNPLRLVDPDGQAPGDIYLFFPKKGDNISMAFGVIGKVRNPFSPGFSHAAVEDTKGNLFSLRPGPKGGSLVSSVPIAADIKNRAGLIMSVKSQTLDLSKLQIAIDQREGATPKFGDENCTTEILEVMRSAGVDLLGKGKESFYEGIPTRLTTDKQLEQKSGFFGEGYFDN